MASPTAPATAKRITDVIRQYWGFETLRPLQREAIDAALAQRDSLVVMPTGGGKSLCYQVPPAVSGQPGVVVSPLISLMKDQVDGLRACGYPAVALHSGLTPAERRDAEAGIREGRFNLVFAAPERLLTSWFIEQMRRMDIRSIAIDEAHCISHWGHDFRPEYRQLAQLHDYFPKASLHAYTATATPRVREDIVRQLKLDNPSVLVGDFDRPNLTFRIIPQVDLYKQTFEVLDRHRDEAVIIYCISRKDTETLAATIEAQGIKAACYHAGLDANQRHRTQEAFANEELNVVVATVAFGMGIDRSNVRCVLHTAMPKSIEHYQQEAGRAGRDGLEAECVLLYSAADVMRWKYLLDQSTKELDDPQAVTGPALDLLSQMQKLCNSSVCRHRSLCEYFGQRYEKDNCGACDVCLDEVEGMEDATVTAQKILSCVARTGQNFGVGHVVDVLVGADTERIRSYGHNQLSTYGLLKEHPKKAVQSFVYQLLDQDVLDRTGDDKPILRLNAASVEVMRGQRKVRLVQPKSAKRTTAEADSWDGVDRPLFEVLRQVRKQIADERGLPPYVIFHDSTLRELARVRPSTVASLVRIRGMGDRKAAEHGEQIVSVITNHCDKHGLTMDQWSQATITIARAKKPSETRATAFRMFEAGESLAAVAAATGRAASTVSEYLTDFVNERRPTSLDAWIEPALYERIRKAAMDLEEARLKPVYEKLDGQVPYDQIRIVMAHLQATA